MEQEIIEIAWVLNDADLKQKLKLARVPATENFVAVIESVERHEEGLQLDALKDGSEVWPTNATRWFTALGTWLTANLG